MKKWNQAIETMYNECKAVSSFFLVCILVFVLVLSEFQIFAPVWLLIKMR